MESFLPIGGFQLPFQQRLSRLYNDTKKSSDFVKEAVQNEEDPEIKALHRKLRIQKDRLVSWGMEWSDPNQSAEIDESLSKAGLSEVVGSIMSTIKDILAEAEPLWLSSKHLVEGHRQPLDRKLLLVQWDKGRFEDLVRDLASSIDTLYDLSRTRSMGAVPGRSSKTPSKMAPSADEFRPFESTRMQTPQIIRPESLTHLRAKEDGGGLQPRQVVFMSKTAYSEITQGSTREPWAPLLLEYAAFDPIYSITGIMPPMSRFEKLSAALQKDPQGSPGVWTGLPRLLGYFEDLEKSRFGLVYRFPPSFNAVSFQRLTQNPHYNLPTLADLLSKPGAEPKLEIKFRLAHNLANTVFDMHTRGITHGKLLPSNISFCDTVQSGPTVTSGDVDFRRPFVSSFDVFPEDAGQTETYHSRYSTDPRGTSSSSNSSSLGEKASELYALGSVLLSIGMWRPIEDLVQPDSANAIPESVLEQLSQKCGTLFMKAVQACLSAAENERVSDRTSDGHLSAVQTKAARFLETCSILDGVSTLEDQISEELRELEAAPRKHLSVSTSTPDASKEPRDAKSSSKSAVQMTQPSILPELIPRAEPGQSDVVDAEADDVLDRLGDKPQKTKLYPSVPLPPDAVEKWNTILMPQINQALRQFYRKHPESVEISLESVGPSPANTRPTVLVVCTSVGKVRALLKKRLGDLFDGSTGFALKVCKGHMVRSRRMMKDAMRSMARRGQPEEFFSKDLVDDVDAINPEYQDRPRNGASIGAWIGDRHLPPVSFGGLIVVDDKMYGMTVHHMLDDPDRDFGTQDATRSSAVPGQEWSAQMSDEDEDDFGYELSDTESEPYSESDITSDWGDDEDEFEEGDIPGIEPGCGDGYIVTQPALDDVEEGFYPSSETEDEDHLDTFSVGDVYASSGIRRTTAGGLTHEVDWALFEFSHERRPEENSVPCAQVAPTTRRLPPKNGQALLRPSGVVQSTSLPGLHVQCMARTSGLQTGQILPALTSVKIYGRASPSHTYQVTSNQSTASGNGNTIPIGIPGDSGAWVLERHTGRLCGHVLAWSQRKQVAYICPMEVLISDIAQTLEASEISLPGGEVLLSLGDSGSCAASQGVREEPVFKLSGEPDNLQDRELASVSPAALSPVTSASSCSFRSLGESVDREESSLSSVRISSPNKMGMLSRSMRDLTMSRGIGVST